MADTPLWLSVIDATSKTVTIAAIVIGGWVGWVRYLRGRLSHAKCDLEVEAELLPAFQGREALRVKVTCQNTGTCLLDLPTELEASPQLQVAALFESSWKKALTTREAPEWFTLHIDKTFLTKGNVSPRDSSLEPGERLLTTILVLLPAKPKAEALRVVAVVPAVPRPKRLRGHLPWSTETIVVRGIVDG